MDDLFRDDDEEWFPPTIHGASAGLNSAMFFTCPLCGTVVLDMEYTKTNRIRHTEWHKDQKAAST